VKKEDRISFLGSSFMEGPNLRGGGRAFSRGGGLKEGDVLAPPTILSPLSSHQRNLGGPCARSVNRGEERKSPAGPRELLGGCHLESLREGRALEISLRIPSRGAWKRKEEKAKNRRCFLPSHLQKVKRKEKTFV